VEHEHGGCRGWRERYKASLQHGNYAKLTSGAPFPTGTLSAMQTTSPKAGITQCKWSYQVADSGEVEIQIFSGSATTMYAEIKQACILRGRSAGHVAGGWKEWPKGFPDKNEYEDVEICGAAEDMKKAAWVQSGFLIVLSVSLDRDGGVKLPNFADGIWGVINKATIKL
jgi:hypothetical protein